MRMPFTSPTATTGKTAGLFGHIEALQGERPWGAVLDAGTGTHSGRWVSSLATDRWTAVTGSTEHAAEVRTALAGIRRPQDRIIVGNWTDPALLRGERYDTVLADYLLGAIEGFAPYFQPRLFDRLHPLVAGRLYVVGLEPYMHERPASAAGRLVWEIGRFRDTCLMLAGEMPYREYPADWVIDHLGRSGFRVLSVEHYPIRYKARFVDGQIDMCASRIARIDDPVLAAALTARGEDIRHRARAAVETGNGLRHGRDYVIAAEPC